jgi:hypothetical protein
MSRSYTALHQRPMYGNCASRRSMSDRSTVRRRVSMDTINGRGNIVSSVAMQCLLGVCQCRLGFTSVRCSRWTFEYNLSHLQTNDDRFPTCVKVCTKVDEVAVIDKCMEKVKLGERCIRTKQCPPLAECRFGTCQCLCGYKQSSFITDQCTNPDDPLSLNTILSSVECIFVRNHETKIDGAL